ncbi:MAG: hypothetical protein P0Y53_16400 [Candidatus Pseudobacter hemicellulosilyticus]|uniref:Uncharacterized protein n=1 Tax=Candidatus Pseudobacter hemicellulosilyticus TaxID=3121375 RepID=A0AAJ6BFU1_9BACT|nr:MAG: hypothetical protein P0Y53_16400 [Pseudobacter sp.]
MAGNQGGYSFGHTPMGNFPGVNFNHKEYLASLQKLVAQKISPDQVLAATMSKINTVKAQYQRSLKQEVEKLQQEYRSRFADSLEINGKALDLSSGDLSGLQRQVIPEELSASYVQHLQTYNNLINMEPSALRDSLLGESRKVIGKYEMMEKVYKKVVTARESFQNNSTVKRLQENLPFSPENYKKYLSNPAELVDVARNQASLSSLQKLFMNITKLDLGVNPVSGGQLDMNNMMNTGLNTMYTGKSTSVGLIYGSGINNVNQLMQAGLKDFASNEFSRMGGIKVGSGWNSKVKQTVSMNFFDFGPSGAFGEQDLLTARANMVAAPIRRDAVITYESDFEVAAGHSLSVDLSKSFGAYRNSSTSDSTMESKAVFGDVFDSKGTQNYAAAIDYQGSFKKITVALSAKKAGAGYNNPGSVFVRRGETRLGLMASGKILNNKLTVRYKTDYRNQYFDPSKNNVYRNFSNQLQLGYRISRSNRVGLSFRDNAYRMKNKTAGVSTNGYTYNLQADAYYTTKIKGLSLINTTILSRQRFEVPMLNQEVYHSNTWLINHFSSLVLNRNILSLSLAVNHSDNKAYFFNTSFVNMDLNYTYAAGKYLRLTSGPGYYINKGWNEQVGIRQQVTASLWDKIDVSLDVNGRKAVRIINPELADQVIFNTSIFYKF